MLSICVGETGAEMLVSTDTHRASMLCFVSLCMCMYLCIISFRKEQIM